MSVHFIGAGPGAEDLITLRGLNIIKHADVCMYAGSLIPEGILNHCKEGAIKINTAPLSLDDIEALFAPITEGHFMDASGLSLQDIYEEVFSMEYEQMKRLKEDLLRKFHASEESFTDQKEDKDYLQLFTFI